jgi:hypothetical protein
MTVVRRDSRAQDSRTQDRRTEVQGRKSHGRKLTPQRQRSPRRNSPVSFVAMVMATWSCSGASSRHCSTISSQRYNAAAHIAAALRHCCSTCRGNVATTLLQLASRQRCCSSRRYDAALARVATMLRRCYCGAVTARSNDEKQRTMQRWQAAQVLAATANKATLLCNDGG